MEMERACYSVSALNEIELQDYRRMSYDFKSYKKTDLDQELNRLHRFIGNELNAILAMIRSGDVDYCP